MTVALVHFKHIENLIVQCYNDDCPINPDYKVNADTENYARLLPNKSFTMEFISLYIRLLPSFSDLTGNGTVRYTSYIFSVSR